MASGPPPSPAVPVTRTGSCLCRAVKYEVIGEPVTIRVCHCGNCKKATGAAFMTNGFFKESVRFVFSLGIFVNLSILELVHYALATPPSAAHKLLLVLHVQK